MPSSMLPRGLPQGIRWESSVRGMGAGAAVLAPLVCTQVGGEHMKSMKEYCSKHPGTRLPKHQRTNDRKTGCCLCVRNYRARTRAQREAEWKQGDLRCARHPNVLAIRSSYLSSGTRHCSRCHRYRVDGTRRPAGLRYERKATATGHRAAWAANRRRRDRLAANTW